MRFSELAGRFPFASLHQDAVSWHAGVLLGLPEPLTPAWTPRSDPRLPRGSAWGGAVGSGAGCPGVRRSSCHPEASRCPAACRDRRRPGRQGLAATASCLYGLRVKSSCLRVKWLKTIKRRAVFCGVA